MSARESHLRDRSVVVWATLIIFALVAAVLLSAGWGEAGWRGVIRVTARTSFALFVTAFAARPLAALWARRWTQRLRAHEAALFVSFAVSHVIHLLAILALARATGGASLRAVGASQIYGGGLAYLFILWLACAAVAGARFERRALRALRSFALYYIWLIFMFSYGGRAALESSRFAPLVLALVVALALRLLSATARRNPLLQEEAG
jgi:hypothetical protein